ncbi:hypothetical protein BTH42_32470 [Burkholderia sp. SRS-W-2-2016]|nr:hypothetical protein BTH42_32470 [Burkholderia sp. SRS-W-2-2016]
MMRSEIVWPPPPTLHVFEQEGGWHWGITVARSREAGGFRVVAFSSQVFTKECDAREDGAVALACREPGAEKH